MSYLGGYGIFYRNIWLHHLLFLILGLNVEKYLKHREVHLLIFYKSNALKCLNFINIWFIRITPYCRPYVHIGLSRTIQIWTKNVYTKKKVGKWTLLCCTYNRLQVGPCIMDGIKIEFNDIVYEKRIWAITVC